MTPGSGINQISLIMAEFQTGKRAVPGAYFGDGDNCSMQLRRRVQTHGREVLGTAHG
jgi:hypothetical protein